MHKHFATQHYDVNANISVVVDVYNAGDACVLRRAHTRPLDRDPRSLTSHPNSTAHDLQVEDASFSDGSFTLVEGPTKMSWSELAPGANVRHAFVVAVGAPGSHATGAAAATYRDSEDAEDTEVVLSTIPPPVKVLSGTERAVAALAKLGAYASLGLLPSLESWARFVITIAAIAATVFLVTGALTLKARQDANRRDRLLKELTRGKK